MSRHEFFVKRLRELGMFDKDSDYDGAIGRAIERISALWEADHHSGMSSELTLQLLNKLFAEWSNR